MKCNLCGGEYPDFDAAHACCNQKVSFRATTDNGNVFVGASELDRLRAEVASLESRYQARARDAEYFERRVFELTQQLAAAQLYVKQHEEVLRELMLRFDNEMWNCERCGHAEQTATMDSAGYLRDYLATATPPDLSAIEGMMKDVERYRFLRSEAYEAVVPHGRTINGSRTAWITKLHAGRTFDEAIDAAIAAQEKP